MLKLVSMLRAPSVILEIDGTESKIEISPRRPLRGSYGVEIL